MEQNWYNKIDAFLDGLLSTEERLAMEEAIAQDTALAREVRLNALQRQALDILKDKKASAEFREWTARPPASLGCRRYLPVLALLLFLLLLGLLVWVFRSSDASTPSSETPEQVVPNSRPADSVEKQRIPKAVVENSTQKQTEESPEPTRQRQRDRQNTAMAALYAEEASSMFDANMSVFRGVDDSTPDQQLFADALQAYQNARNPGEYQEVVTRLNQIKATGKLGVDVTYLKGYALFKARRFEAAADTFAAVAATGAYSKEPKWKEALSLYAAGATQKERLKGILDEVVSGAFPKAKKDQASILMEKLR
ncbi:MAG: hypothetical protein LCH81_12360 [Bacteroidetes bacterium]|nr:hypothetical protein [Bacteroidota bacterium]